ncbi:MAG TPA: hypothetical protein VLG40_05255, partial [Candidatus Saccharimonas sp.]|nr:hypothetical protein [Candidatus Saccharimonas sp.]
MVDRNPSGVDGAFLDRQRAAGIQGNDPRVVRAAAARRAEPPDFDDTASCPGGIRVESVFGDELVVVPVAIGV